MRQIWLHKAFALLLAVCLLAGLTPVTARAADASLALTQEEIDFLSLLDYDNAENLGKYLTEDIGARSPASIGRDMAADFIMEELESYGYAPYIHSFTVSSSYLNGYLDIDGRKYAYYGPGYAADTVYSFKNATVDLTGVAVINWPSMATALTVPPGTDFEGKAVFVTHYGLSNNANYYNTCVALQNAGAGAVIFEREPPYNLNGFSIPRIGNTTSGTEITIPVGLTLYHETHAMLGGTDENTAVTVTMETRNDGKNVVAVLPSASGSQKTVYVTAHYDTVVTTPGMNDNASGTMMALEMARAFKNHEFEYNIVFVLFDAEEQGLIGSKAFCSGMTSVERANFVANYNMDMIATSAQNCSYIYLSFSDSTATSPAAAQKYDAFNHFYLAAQKTGFDMNRFGISPATNSDHHSFYQNTMKNAVMPTWRTSSFSYEGQYHTSSDSYESNFSRPKLEIMGNIIALAVYYSAISFRRDPVQLIEAKAAITWDLIRGDNIEQNNVIYDLILPTAGLHGTSISWWSGHAAIDANTGVVTRPTASGDITFPIRATVTLDGFSEMVTFHPTVKRDPEQLLEAKAAITWDLIRGDNIEQNNVMYDLILPTAGLHGTTISWWRSNTAIDASSGVVTRPKTGSDRKVTLIATVTQGDFREMVTFNLTVRRLPDPEQLLEAKAAITWDLIRGDNTAQNNIVYNLILPTAGLHGTSISWRSGNTVVNAGTGVVTRPVSGGNRTFALTATVSLDGFSDTVTFTLTVIQLPSTDAARVAEAKSVITWDLIKGDNISQNDVLYGLNLPATGLHGTSINWSTGGLPIDTNTGSVTRPAHGTGSVSGTLTATVSLNSASDTVPFFLTVIEQDPPDAGVALTGKFISWNPKAVTTIHLIQDGKTVDTVYINDSSGVGMREQSFTFENIAPGTYDLVITKEGHTSFTVQKVVVDNQNVDLTQDTRPEVRMMTLRCGDINNDGMINDADLAILWLAANYNKSTAAQGVNPSCDLNGDGMINDADLAILWLASNYNKGAVVIALPSV